MNEDDGRVQEGEECVVNKVDEEVTNKSGRNSKVLKSLLFTSTWSKVAGSYFRLFSLNVWWAWNYLFIPLHF